jgi:hypothetical protein
MNENFDLVLQIVRVDFFIAFGLYSILYVITSLFTKSSVLKIIDEYASKVIVHVSVIFFLVWIILILSTYSQSTEEDRAGMIQRMFGKYWFGFWFQPILWLLSTQLLRFQKIRSGKIWRIICSILLLISIEQFVIIVTLIHRDYLPDSWSATNSWGIPFTPLELILGIITKVLLFLAFVGIYYFLEQKIKTIKIKRNK